MTFCPDKTEVFFSFLKDPVTVSSVFCEIDLPFLSAPVTIRWYGVIIAFGLTLAVLFGGRKAYVWKMDINKMLDILIYGALGGIIGARLYYVFSKWDYYSVNPSEIFQIWNGGLAIYGGIIGGLLCAFVVCKIEKINIPNLLDMVGMSLLIGQGIGRWGNYANQEAFGSFTNGNFGMMSDTVVDYIVKNPSYYGLEGVKDIPSYIAENNLFVPPTFFYESVWCLTGFLILYIVLKKARKFSGQMFLMYGVWYGLERFIVEGLRSDSLYIGNTTLRVSQLISLGLVLVCGVLLVFNLIKYTKNPKPIEGIDYFNLTEKEKALDEKRQERRIRNKAKLRMKQVEGQRTGYLL